MPLVPCVLGKVFSRKDLRRIKWIDDFFHINVPNVRLQLTSRVKKTKAIAVARRDGWAVPANCGEEGDRI